MGRNLTGKQRSTIVLSGMRYYGHYFAFIFYKKYIDEVDNNNNNDDDDDVGLQR